MQRSVKRTRATLAGAMLVTASLGLWVNANAVVTQVNGLIVPNCADNIAYALTRGELAGNATGACSSQFPIGSVACWSQTQAGVPDCSTTAPPTVPNNNGSPGSQGPINPVNEARLDPQVFAIPKVPAAAGGTVFGKVTGTFLWRNTAGYRNTFGWYNVGDDVTVLTNLHPILPSWPPPTGANGAPYDQAGTTFTIGGNSVQAPFQATVDFQAEFTAGRYKGGFVGFYLMAPQGQAGVNTTTYPNYDGCTQISHARGYYPYVNFNAAAKPPAPPPDACVGYTYFTERALNGDGNYVHFLIFQTNVLDQNKVRFSDFYFTFEDTYRSNDIGYADNTMFVQGLVVPCLPQPETCNGLDDDCDGVIDNSPVDAGGSCSNIPGNKPGVGICKAGTLVCRLPTSQGGVAGTSNHASADQLFCDGEVGPQQEQCDGLDNDCSGKVDDPGGVIDPTKQIWGPVTNTVPLPDECASLTGACTGTTECISGAPTCVGTTFASPEKCDGKDNNCNGIIDDNPTDVGASCYPPGGTPTGACRAGTTVCLPGGSATDTLQCQGWVGPSPEVCNGIDDNCNGQVDENATDVGPKFPCTPANATGVCTPGYFVCVNGARVCENFGFGTPETCNGKDDDCNGVIDNNPIDANVPCGSSVGACKPGTLVCRLPDSAGGMPGVPNHDPNDKLICDGGQGPTAEQCDGIDNNCNGVVDDGPDGTPNSLPGVGVDCTTPCGKGKTVCKDGSIQCVGTSGGTVETCNGKDDDCNGIIDNNPIDVGGQCGTVVIDPSIKQNPECALGEYVCRLPESQGGVPGQSDHAAGDQIFCDDQVTGSDEVCNGVDDNCNGVVDENVPGQGGDCLPDSAMAAGLTLPLLGECRPGHLYCIDGKMQCTGGVGPEPELCDGRDHNCDGKVDSGSCTDPSSKCIRGACRRPCSNAELGNCPGGSVCVQGYCVPEDCNGLCKSGTTCNTVTGECESSDGGIAVSRGGAAGSGSSRDAGVSGATSSSDGSTAAQDAGSGGAPGSTPRSSANGTQDPTRDVYGLSTGGGGCACTVTPAGHSTRNLGVAALFLLAALRRRRPRRARREGGVHV
jgi:MYXO-CTERM domain-containing protein